MALTPFKTPQWKHDVFISFRSVDTRFGFLSHLQKALIQTQIVTFVDDQLGGGENITPALLKKIEESKISLVIFSKNYADSPFCLDELVKILECKERLQQMVLPVFYLVDPTHVQELRGSFGDAIAKHQHQREFSQDRVDRWSNALREIANLKGWDSCNFKSESNLIEEIVSDIFKKLELIPISSYDLPGLIGVESRIKEVVSLLCIGSLKVRVVGIWGMGGIGKTTIAEAVFNLISPQFEGRCFERNVREKLDRCTTLDHLINNILSKVLDTQKLNIGTLMIPNFIRNMLQKKKVLIVLDDVNSSHQQLIDQLVGQEGLLFAGSRIILTGRDKQVLDTNGRAKIYKVKLLDYHESHLLFSLHAFTKICPAKDPVLLRRAVNYGKGNPLALKILGSSLNNKSSEVWESELAKIEKTPDNEIQTILRISYDELDQNEKDMFLDMACFFKRWGKYRVEMILDGCNFHAKRGLSRLIDKSLITISDIDGVEMHDLVEQMGKHIVCEEHRKKPGKRSRLWDPKDIRYVLTQDKGTETIEAISLDTFGIEGDMDVSPTAFTKMYSLRLLQISSFGLRLPKGLQFLPNSLRLLLWDDYPLKSLPSNFCPENLVELRMHNSHVKQLWDGVQPKLMNLKILKLSFSKDLIRILGDFSKVPNLEVIDLNYCTSLVEIPSSIRCCSKLTSLNLEGCKNLCRFPSCLHPTSANPSWLHVTSAKHFSLTGCSKITEFPDVPWNIKWLDIVGTAIKQVPPLIGHLSHLHSLSLAGSESLESLPSSIGNLKCLQFLDLRRCSMLANLPNSSSSLFNLTHLILSYCERLQCLPELPLSLQELNASYCTSLRSVPSLLFWARTVPSLLMTGTGMIKFDFYNCFNLDQSIIMCDALLIFERGLRELSVCIPGNHVPEWFWHKKTGSNITLTPKSHHNNCEITGWAFCAVVRNRSSDAVYEETEVECRLEPQPGLGRPSYSGVTWYAPPRESDHVILWNYPKFVPIKQARFLTTRGVIKKCGVHPMIGQYFPPLLFRKKNHFQK